MGLKITDNTGKLHKVPELYELTNFFWEHTYEPVYQGGTFTYNGQIYICGYDNFEFAIQKNTNSYATIKIRDKVGTSTNVLVIKNSIYNAGTQQIDNKNVTLTNNQWVNLDDDKGYNFGGPVFGSLLNKSTLEVYTFCTMIGNNGTSGRAEWGVLWVNKLVTVNGFNSPSP
jgi:hypothetical protein